MKKGLSKKAEEISLTLKQLAHPDRLMVLCHLLEGEKTVNELVEYIGASQSWVSQFLSKMKLSGLIDSKKKGIFVYYRITEPRLKSIITAIYKAYCATNKESRSQL